jgi:hypothetical protein
MPCRFEPDQSCADDAGPESPPYGRRIENHVLFADYNENRHRHLPERFVGKDRQLLCADEVVTHD